jgi:probable F420-dependent oxidoreductase
MDLSVVLFTSDRGITPARAAKAAEAAGFHGFYVPEHSHIPTSRDSAHPGTGGELPDDRYLRILDPWVALATAAAVTSTIRLGTAVALPMEHDPITLAKTLATLDHLSDGRVTLGVGFGWNVEELEDHGVPGNKRRTVLREYLELMQRLWSEEVASYAGEFAHLEPSWAFPKPVQQPRIPILVGAGGTPKNFDWIVANADGWITTPIETDIEDRVAALNESWTAAGREGDPRIVVLLTSRLEPGQLERWGELGVDEVMFGLPDRGAEDVETFIARLGASLHRPAEATA